MKLSGIGAITTALTFLSPTTLAVTPPPPPKTGSAQFKHFVAHHETHTCTGDSHATPFNNQIRGVNLGGWMVLEPWITPSLFLQFLGNDEYSTGLDMHSFCQVLGPAEGNKQLQRHWKTWVTEAIIQKLAESGAVNSLRLPVGDWMYKPYGPYMGCTDGALDHVDFLLDWAHENGLNVLLDVHGLKGSQNGFDNSGQSQGFEWTSKLVSEWPIQQVFNSVLYFCDLTPTCFPLRTLSQPMMLALNIGPFALLDGWENSIPSMQDTKISTMTTSNMPSMLLKQWCYDTRTTQPYLDWSPSTNLGNTLPSIT